MGRRFGRNRRRKMREELANVREALALQEQLTKELVKNKSRAEDQLNRIASIVGSNFYGLDPSFVRANSRFRGGIYTIPVYDNYPEATDGPSNYPTESTFRSLELLVMDVSEKSDYFQTCVHVRLGNSHEVAYAVSEQALTTAPRDVLIEMMSHELAIGIANAFAKKKVSRVASDLAMRQEPLEREIGEAIHKNLLDLYED